MPEKINDNSDNRMFPILILIVFMVSSELQFQWFHIKSCLIGNLIISSKKVQPQDSDFLSGQKTNQNLIV
jgi:hypothetical protein